TAASCAPKRSLYPKPRTTKEPSSGRPSVESAAPRPRPIRRSPGDCGAEVFGEQCVELAGALDRQRVAGVLELDEPGAGDSGRERAAVLRGRDRIVRG